MARDVGDAVWLRLGRRRLLVLSHPQLIEEALVTRARSFVKEKVLWGGWSEQLVVREGIGTLGSGDWQTHTQSRRRLQPAFAPARLDDLRPVVRDVALDLIEGWRDGDEVDVLAAMRQFSVVAFSASMLGERLDDATAADLGGRLSAAIAPYRPVSSLLFLSFTLLRRRQLARAVRATAETQAWLAALIAARESENASLLAPLRLSDLDSKTQAEDAFTVQLAGVDTSASVLGWLCYVLACHPELCARLASEWEASDDGRQPLPLAGRVFQETLRLYPASWFVARRALVGETLAGTHVAPGTTVVMSPFVVHRDRRWYDDPSSFEPDRWLAATDLPRFAFFAFGGGVRQCIGERLARLEGEVLAGALAAHVTLLPPSRPPVVQAGASLRFHGRLTLEARRR